MEHVDSASDTHALHRRTAERLDEIVVAAAGRDRDIAALREFGIGEHEFEHGAGVVVEAPHQSLGNLVGMAEPLDAGDDLREVLAIFGAEEVVHLRRGRDERPILRVLRIEDAQRVPLESLLGLIGERVAILGEVGGERLLHLWLTFRVADRVQLELVRAKTDLREEARGEVDDLDVGEGLLGTEALETPLPELAVAQELRPLPAEHRLVVEEAHRSWRTVQAVLEEGSRHRRRTLRTQHQAALAVQRHVVHLVTDDVARFAHRFREHPAILDDRRRDPRIAVAQGARLDHRLQRVEGGRFFGEQVPHPARGLKTSHRDADDKPLSSNANKSSRHRDGWRNDNDRAIKGHRRAHQGRIFLVHVATGQGTEDCRALRRKSPQRFLRRPRFPPRRGLGRAGW